ncbi:MAG: hypothetical protein K6F50_07250 [Kiritimatiellae bacterium]|nr:hypothetical protein [Kiritimatiellia bacterium]
MAKAAGKVIKWTLMAFAVLLGLVLVAALTIPLWIGPVVTGKANELVPQMTKTGFRMEDFGFNPYSGTIHFGKTALENPVEYFDPERARREAKAAQGEGEKNIFQSTVDAVNEAAAKANDLISSSSTNAVAFNSIDVDFDTVSLFSDTMRIKEIEIDGLYIYGNTTFANIREIVANVTEYNSKGKETPKAEPEPGREEKAQEPAPAPEGEAKKDEGGKKYVIEKIRFKGLEIKYAGVSIGFEDFELPPIGTDHPVDIEATLDIVVEAICGRAEKKCPGAGKALWGAYAGGKGLTKAFAFAAEVMDKTFDKAGELGTKFKEGVTDLF